MRIRKRFLLSSLSSLPLSDPQLNRSPLVVQQQQQLQEGGQTVSQPSDSPNQQPPPPPSDQKMMIGSGKPRWIFSNRQKEMEGEEERWEEEEKSNDTKKGSILGAEVGSGQLLSKTGSSHQEVGRWSEGDKVVPPKKRRGSFERKGNDDDEVVEKEKKTNAIMKSKTNRKCVQQLPNIDEEDEEQTEDGNIRNSYDDAAGGKTKKPKKVKRGNVIMEGSRCSRVNGRGWRCFQQTLVGYSLCEHHLGKGRLRSIASVRNRAMANTASAPKRDESRPYMKSTGKLGQRLSDDEEVEEDEDDDDDDDDGDDDEEEEEKTLVTRKKRMKIGMVKARSISSLLGQTNNAVVVVNDHHKTKTPVDIEED